MGGSLGEEFRFSLLAEMIFAQIRSILLIIHVEQSVHLDAPRRTVPNRGSIFEMIKSMNCAA